jgi:hypothetical protein
MARAWSGSGKRPVTFSEHRARNLRELFLALSSPGCCIVLGAGASYGVVPMRPDEIARLAIKLLRASGSFQALSTEEQDQAKTPEVLYLVSILQPIQSGAWDRVITDMMSGGQASYILNTVFTPEDVPQELVQVYRCFERSGGKIVSYNYDPIATKQDRFPVIFPHGRTSPLFTDPRARATTITVAREFHQPIANDWHLPVPETDGIRERRGYRETVEAWMAAKSIILVGFGFGSGADGISFEDFGQAVSPVTPVHVLCPRPDNADLCKQVGYGLRGREQPLIYSQPFSWRAFATAILWLLECFDRTSIGYLVGWEALVARAHDEGGRPAWARFWRTRSPFV